MGIFEKAKQAAEQAADEARRRAEGAAAQLTDPSTQEKAKQALDMAGKQSKVGLGHARRGISTAIDRIDPERPGRHDHQGHIAPGEGQRRAARTGFAVSGRRDRDRGEHPAAGHLLDRQDRRSRAGAAGRGPRRVDGAAGRGAARRREILALDGTVVMDLEADDAAGSDRRTPTPAPSSRSRPRPARSARPPRRPAAGSSARRSPAR